MRDGGTLKRGQPQLAVRLDHTGGLAELGVLGPQARDRVPGVGVERDRPDDRFRPGLQPCPRASKFGASMSA